MEELQQNGSAYLPIELAIELIRGGEFEAAKITGAESFEKVENGWVSLPFFVDMTRLSSPRYAKEGAIKAILNSIDELLKSKYGKSEVVICIGAKL